jgi:alpha-tubulin suppressor-like RCC1 family protein
MFRTKYLSALALASAFLLPTAFLNASPQQGQAWAWGFGRNGELGLGSESNSSLPHAIKNAVFVDIDAKRSFSAGVTADGQLFTWGKNRNGVLGHLPANLNLLLPRKVEFEAKVKQVSLGYQSMCVVTEAGEAYVWGLAQKNTGFRSISTTEPEKHEATLASTKVSLSDVQMASCANDYVVFVTKQGKVFVMGDTKVRGVNNSQAQLKTDLVELPLDHITKISSGVNFTIALDDEGRVFVWGNNTYGQLGNGGLKNAIEPIQIEALAREKVVDISAGDNYSGAVT